MKRFPLLILLVLLLGVGTVSISGCITVIAPQPSDSPTSTPSDSAPTPNEPALDDSKIVVEFFTASPPDIPSGNSSKLNWSVTGATAVIIDQGIGNVGFTGDIMVSPIVTTVYSLTASNAVETVVATTQVTVLPVSLMNHPQACQ